MSTKKRPAGQAAEALNKVISQKPYRASPHENQAIPSRAVLARKWPRLKINRLSGRWIDDASGAKGDDVETLLAYLAEGGR